MKSKPVTSTSTKLLQSIDKLPLETFIDCIVDHNYSGLIIEGTPTEAELQTCFDNIYEQYIEGIGGKELVRHLADVKQIALMQSKILRAESLLEIIQLCPTIGLFEQLYTFGYALPKEKYSYYGINKVLRIFVAKYKKDKTETDRLIFQFEHSQQSEKKGESSGYTRDYFYNSIVEMSTAFKFPIQQNITLALYCSYMRKYKDLLNTLQKQQQ